LKDNGQPIEKGLGMSKYADIIEKLETATGPSRELDGMIWAALNPKAKVKDVFPAYGIERKTRIMFTLPPKRTELVTKDVGEFLDALDWSASLDASVSLMERMLPGWGWRGGSCHLSDDCFVFPDYNCPTHGERLKREFSVKIDGQEWSDYTDIDLRPAGRLPIAILLSMFTALAGIEKIKEVKP
jgi:hypothetical protein